MKPLRPYLLRALYDWMLDNGNTPHVLVDATVPGVQVPPELVQQGRITLNIHPNALQGFYMDEHGLRFSARFGGVSRPVEIPIRGVLGVVARETGRGMQFEDEDFGGGEPPQAPTPPPSAPAPTKPDRPGPSLRVVK